MSDRELKIKITGDASSAVDAAKQTGNALGGLTDKTGETAKGVEKLEINHHALHKIMHLIGANTAPELGQALTGAMYGPIGIALALGAAFEFLHRKIEAVKQAQEELEKATSEKLAETLKDQGEAAEKAAEGFAKLFGEIKTAGEGDHSPQAQLKHEIELIDEYITKSGELMEARKKLLLSQAGSQEEKDAIEARFAQSHADLQAGGATGKYLVRRHAVENAAADLSSATQDAGTAKHIVNRQTDALKALTDALNESLEKVSHPDPNVAADQARYPGLKFGAPLWDVKKNQEAVDEAAARLTAAQEEEKSAKKRVTDLSKMGGPGALEDLQREKEKLDRDAAARRLNELTAQGVFQPGYARNVMSAAHDASGPSQAEADAKAAAFVNGAGLNGKVIVELLHRGVNGQDVLARELEIVSRKYAQLEQRLKNAAGLNTGG